MNRKAQMVMGTALVIPVLAAVVFATLLVAGFTLDPWGSVFQFTVTPTFAKPSWVTTTRKESASGWPTVPLWPSPLLAAAFRARTRDAWLADFGRAGRAERALCRRSALQALSRRQNAQLRLSPRQ